MRKTFIRIKVPRRRSLPTTGNAALLKRIKDDPARWRPAHERATNAAGTLGADLSSFLALSVAFGDDWRCLSTYLGNDDDPIEATANSETGNGFDHH